MRAVSRQCESADSHSRHEWPELVAGETLTRWCRGWQPAPALNGRQPLRSDDMPNEEYRDGGLGSGAWIREENSWQ